MNFIATLKRVFLVAAILVAQIIAGNPAQAVNIQTLTSPAGIKVYLVENYTTPLITVSFSFQGGATQDPIGKEGVTRLLAAMLDEGAGAYDGQEFQRKSEELGMDLSFSAGRDYFTGTMQTLAQNANQSFELFRLALNEPRFEATPMERMRQAILANLKRAKTNPQSIASRVMRKTLFKDHPYARSNRGRIDSVEKLTRADLQAIYQRLLVKQGMVIGVVGAIDSTALVKIVDKVFGDLPSESKLTPIAEAKIDYGDNIRESLDIPQSIVSFALPGLKRSDPEFFAAYLANHILGGGSFSSRLYDEIREKRGLAYSVYSHLATYSHAAFTVVGSATSNERVEKAIEVIQSELTKMAKFGPTEAELESAKKYVIGSYAIRNLDTSAKVAGVLVAIQQIDLGIDYLDRREVIINAVTLADVKRVAARLLKNKPTLVVVGPKTN